MNRRVIVLALLAGIVVGAGGAVFLPGLLAPYLSGVIGKGTISTEGTVVGKKLEANRLLLTIRTDQGAILATFKNKVAEIDLLIQSGDTLTLGLQRYEPFVEDPEIERVAKEGTVRGIEEPSSGETSEDVKNKSGGEAGH